MIILNREKGLSITLIMIGDPITNPRTNDLVGASLDVEEKEVIPILIKVYTTSIGYAKF